jgi:hypothetical protein
MSDIIYHPRPQKLKWAHHENANLKEPIDALKEKGWQYADVPTASNFNWLVHELSKWDMYLDERLYRTGNNLDKLQLSIHELKKDLKSMSGTLSALIQRVISHHPHPPFLHVKLPDFDD